MLDDNAFGADALRAVLKRIREVAGDDGPYACTIRDLVAEALAVPKRNCDRFATAYDALDAYKETLRDGEVVLAYLFAEWAFDTTNE